MPESQTTGHGIRHTQRQEQMLRWTATHRTTLHGMAADERRQAEQAPSVTSRRAHVAGLTGA